MDCKEFIVIYPGGADTLNLNDTIKFVIPASYSMRQSDEETARLFRILDSLLINESLILAVRDFVIQRIA